MINEYFRPKTVEEAVGLLAQEQKFRRPLAGGTKLSRKKDADFDVVDLQNVGLDSIEKRNAQLKVGSMTRLTTLLQHPDVNLEIKRAIRTDTNENICNAASVGGWVVSSGGRSILSTLLLALDTSLTCEPGPKKVPLGDWFPVRHLESPGLLITHLDLWNDINTTFEYVARSPKDQPTLIVAVAQWGSGRTRIALGGYGEAPIIAMDGPEGEGAEAACRDAYFDADDVWASALYRREVASRLAARCLEKIKAMQGRED
jgi:CO/xanthine dehydrogenase FAD-binding subunit